jgi:hypothetical protein
MTNGERFFKVRQSNLFYYGEEKFCFTYYLAEWSSDADFCSGIAIIKPRAGRNPFDLCSSPLLVSQSTAGN